MHIPKVEWAVTCEPPKLKSSEVHIWRFDLSEFVNTVSEMRQILSADECARADRFHFEKDRTRFVIRRGVLRKLLSKYVSIEPADLRFAHNNFDKPALEGDERIVFNASSSQDVGIVGIAHNAKLGMDVEFVDTTFPHMEIAKRYFSDDEVRALQALPSELRTTVFFDCWTKKEAYVKAIGDGMSLTLPTLTISCEGSEVFSVTARSEEMSGWSFESFFVEENSIASIAVEGEPTELHYFKWAE